MNIEPKKIDFSGFTDYSAMKQNYLNCRIVTFKSNEVQSFGVLTDEGVIDLSNKFPNFATLREVIRG